MPSKPGEEPAGKELIAFRKFSSLTIKEKSPGLKASGKKSLRDGEAYFFFSSSAISPLNEANESSENNNLMAPLISKSATFASTFLANDKCVPYVEAGGLPPTRVRFLTGEFCHQNDVILMKSAKTLLLTL
jgi:hypothetical protein